MPKQPGLSCAKNPVESDHTQGCPDEGRRSLARVILGAVGASVGVSALGCGGAIDLDSPENQRILDTARQAVDNIPLDACDTISDLRNVVPVPVSGSKVVLVLGYSADNDGGGGPFFWDGASTETDNGGTIIQSSLSASGRWKRIYSGPLNVRWFGAKGDGSANDTDAIQKALNQFSGAFPVPGDGSDAKSGAIYFPKGQYKITSTLTYIGNVSVGLNMKGDLADNGGSNGVDLQWFGPSNGILFHAYALNTSVWENLVFDGRGNTLYTCQFDTRQPEGGAGSSFVRFYNCIFAGNNGISSASVAIGRIGNTQQVDSYHFIDCSFTGRGLLTSADGAGFLVLGGGNQKNFGFLNCRINGYNRGIDWSAASGTLDVINSGGGNYVDAWIFLGAGNATIVGCEVENGMVLDSQFFKVAGASNNPASVVATANDIECNTSGTRGIVASHFGQIVLIGNLFRTAQGIGGPPGSSTPQINVSGTNPVGSCFSFGNTYYGTNDSSIVFVDGSGNDVGNGGPGTFADLNFPINLVSVCDNGGLGGSITQLKSIVQTNKYKINSQGKTIYKTGGSADVVGQATLGAGGTVAVNTGAIASGSRVFLSRASISGTPGNLSYGSIVESASFVISSDNGADRSVVNWWILQ